MATKTKKRRKGAKKAQGRTSSKASAPVAPKSDSSKVASITPKTEPLGIVGRAVQFLKEVRVEFDKVTWSSRKETVALTVSVLGFTFFLTIYLGVVDIALSKLVRLLIY